jgi:hypothetical protein
VKSSELVEKLEAFCKENGLPKPNIDLSPTFYAHDELGKPRQDTYQYSLVRVELRAMLEE